MNKKTDARELLYAVIGIIVVLVTLCAFFLIKFDKVSTNYVGFWFLLFSEIIMFSGIIFIKRIKNDDKTFLASGFLTILSLYFIVSLLLFIFSGWFRRIKSVFMFTEIALMAVFIILLIVIGLSHLKIRASNKSTAEKRQFMQLCTDYLYNMSIDDSNVKYKERLKLIYENAKYSDSVGESFLDEKISDEMVNLKELLEEENRNDEQIEKAIDKINTLLSSRKAEISNSKRGSF